MILLRKQRGWDWLDSSLIGCHLRLHNADRIHEILPHAVEDWLNYHFSIGIEHFTVPCWQIVLWVGLGLDALFVNPTLSTLSCPCLLQAGVWYWWASWLHRIAYCSSCCGRSCKYSFLLAHVVKDVAWWPRSYRRFVQPFVDRGLLTYHERFPYQARHSVNHWCSECWISQRGESISIQRARDVFSTLLNEHSEWTWRMRFLPNWGLPALKQEMCGSNVAWQGRNHRSPRQSNPGNRFKPLDSQEGLFMWVHIASYKAMMGQNPKDTLFGSLG